MMKTGNEEGLKMMRKFTLTNQGTPVNHMAGVVLLDVVLGIVIFVVGMLDLAQLQGNLTRSGADANTRTVGANVAEEIIEAARAFAQVPTDPLDVIPSFADIVSETRIVTRGGIDYTAIITVEDYYYRADLGLGSFSTTQPDTPCNGCVGIVYPDFKYVEVEVGWNSSQQFQISEGQLTGDLLGSGSITLTDIISSVPSFSGAKVAAASGDQEYYAPDAVYTPGTRPDAASIDLGNDRFKESSTPVSEIDLADGIVENWFDVATYQQIGADAIFIRREEIVTVSCQCSLLAAVSENGRRPTVWDGAEYSEGEFVTKTYGERPDEGSNNPDQSLFCIQCCRDHHDGGSGANDQSLDPGRSLYNPFKSSSEYHTSGIFSGDHKHYTRNDVGELVVVESAGSEYIEACRLVRKEGFFRVVQDFRQEGLYAFPEDYLVSDSDQSEYSGFVGEAATTFVDAAIAADPYESNPPTLLTPGAALTAVVFPASTYANPTSLPLNGSDTQQMNSRGIYVDYLSDDLRDVVNCLDGGILSAFECGATENVLKSIEVIPFFDVQLTWLARWNETPVNTPVEVTNEKILTDNAHDRGLAALQSGGTGMSEVETDIHKGNLGFTGTDPIIPDDFSEFTDYGLYVSSAASIIDAVADSAVVSGSLISGNNALGFNVADVTLTGSQARCGQTNSGYTCAIDVGATYPTVLVDGYDVTGGNSKTGCSGTLSVDSYDKTWTLFILPTTSTSGADIVMVAGTTCPTF